MSYHRFILDNKYLPLVVFAVSMGFLEAIVVVYVRELYYPEGFQFPLKALPRWLIVVEWVREITTLLMLGSVAFISGKTFLKRLSVFLLIFGIWDIIYYVGLKIFLNWPESILTWDILFLIPIIWVGPVLTPVLCSLLMIVMAVIFDNLLSREYLLKLSRKEFSLMILGAAIIYFTFTIDFGMILIRNDFLKDFSNLTENQEFIKILTTWQPTRFNWEIFAVGIAFIISGLLCVKNRTGKSQNQ